MDKLVIEGGVRLEGEVPISGAKNAALPILCAALLTPDPLIVENVPDLRDVGTMLSLLAQMGLIVLGLFATNNLGINGAVLQMVNHGLISAALFPSNGGRPEIRR